MVRVVSVLQHGSDAQQPLAFGSFRNWLRLLHDNGGIERAYLRRAAFVTLVSLATGPLRLYERRRYHDTIRRSPLPAPPIFVVGHWRSGTTHLHNLLCQDSRFGYVTTFQTLAPDLLFVGARTLMPLLRRMAPTTRAMDNVSLSLDGPQEEELAIAALSPYSFFHGWSFPRRARHYFERYALFQGISAAELARWQAVYDTVLRKATLAMGGRRLALKNPANTGRIPALLEMFPDARFIHIYRNPYAVFLSTRHFYERSIATFNFQRVTRDEIEANVLLFYRLMMRKYLDDRKLIPVGNLVEVRFEDLEADPLSELRRVYEHAALPGFAAVEGDFQAYCAAQRGYRKNRFEATDAAIGAVERHWRFALEEWGYSASGSSG
jgi:hypothetical protein